MMSYTLTLDILPGALAICRLPPETPLPPWAYQGAFASVTRSSDELSIVCDAGAVPDAVLCARGWRGLRVAGPLDFALTGVLASLAAPLAGAGVSIFAVSTYNTDYLLVKEEQLERACAALRAAGHEVRGRPAD